MSKHDVHLSRTEAWMRAMIQRYNHRKYWKYRAIVVDPQKGSRLGDLFRLFYIKRADAFNNASMGTHRSFGAVFAEPPHLPHGLNGIIVSHNAVIGRDCTIFHQVRIGEGNSGAPIIGDHVLTGAGAKIIGGIRIGNNVRIGSGSVVIKDVPDGATVGCGENRMIIRGSNDEC